MQSIVLDCTLRDGGYYNNWDFDHDLVSRYLSAMAAAGVNTVEMGFRFPSKEGFLGANAFTSDLYLRTLDIPSGLQCAVMLNGADFLLEEGTNSELLDYMFNACKDSPVDMVRIAINVRQATRAQGLVQHLKSLGYQIGFNLMQVSTIDSAELGDITGQIANWGGVDVLYFADSLGNMNASNIQVVVDAMRNHWDGPLGIHAHNNMGRALENTLYAQSLGVEYLDCTVTGMGRGAGNAQTEYLMLEIAEDTATDQIPLMQLVAEDFDPMKREHQWGENLYYRLAAKHSIHPSYVQNMLQHENFTPTNILNVLDALAEESSTSYSSDRLSSAMRSRTEISVEGTCSAAEVTSKDSAILLAAGSGGERHLHAISDFQRLSGFPLYSINTFSHIPEDVLQGTFMCDPTRIVANIDEIKRLNCQLIMPKAMLGQNERDELSSASVLDIGVSIRAEPGQSESMVYIPKLLTMAYALQILYASGVRHFYLAGFDGYKMSDPLHEEVEELIAEFQRVYPDLMLTAVTPTSYTIDQRSIYSLMH